MIVPVLLLILSCLGAIYALIQPGAQDWLLLALPAAVASLLLLIRARLRQGRPLRRRTADRRPSGRRPAKAGRHVIVDGSNVLHWKDNIPQIAPLCDVIAQLQAQGLTPNVIFDANVGYKIGEAYMHDHDMGRALGLPASRVLIVDRGTPADPVILAAARDSGARIVTNDRYRDWLADYPEAAEPGHLVRGGYRDGKLWLAL